MVYVVPEFADETVSVASEKWLRNNDKQCFFPKTNILSKIKNEADVDTKSGEWSLHSCRLLFKGERFATYKEAREREKIAQNHSTMSSFRNSYLAKQQARKHPTVFDSSSSSSSEDETKDFKNIKKLSKLDAGLAMNDDKKYNYNRNDNHNHSSSSEQSLNIDNEISLVRYGSRSSEKSDDRSVKSGSTNSDTNKNPNNCDDWSINSFSTNRENENASGASDENSSDMEIYSEDDDNFVSNDDDKSQSIVNESNFLINIGNNLESTEQLPSPSGYDFNDDRRVVRLEKLITHACQELESIKKDVKEIKNKSNETDSAIQNLALVCKDLSVEVFACTEEIKKRNGMFTDMLVPDIKLPIKRTKQCGDVEFALKRHKIVDNLIKYLASTVNETKEKPFIRKCFSVIFGLKFFCLKVWWKAMPEKVNIKNTQILHCMRESFKIKFGLVEPKKTDKEIESFIYKIGRNIKDSWRKIQKKNVNKDDVAGQNKDDWNALLRNGCRRKTGMEQDKGVKREENAKADEKSEENKKAAKKTKGAKQVSEETTRSAAKNVIAAKEDKPKSKKRKIERDVDAQKDEEATQAAEEEDKKAKKAAKKARKAKEAALENDARKDEEATRAAEEATRAAEEATRAAEEDKEAKKALKKARKSKKAADTARDDDTRAAEKATPTAEEEVKQREDIPKPKKNRAERGDRFESKGKVKKCKKE